MIVLQAAILLEEEEEEEVWYTGEDIKLSLLLFYS